MSDPGVWDEGAWDQVTWTQDLAQQVLTAAPYSDGTTTFYPAYDAVGTVGYLVPDQAQQMEGGSQ